MKRHLLLVDGDPRSRRLLEVSLRKAGYTVTPAEDGEEALELARDAAPDLILADTVLPRLDGFGLVAALRRDPSLANVPLVFLSSDTSLTSKVRGLELGIEYLTKPIYIREVLTRVSLEIERASRKVIELKTDATTRFSGTLADMALVDLLQTIDVSRKSGVLRVSSTAGDGHLWFRDGQVVDAETKNLTGALAIYRILTWNEGSFELTFGRVDRKGVLDMSTQALLLEGMRRIDEWGRTTEQLPPLDATLEVNEDALLKQLAVLPDDTNQLLKLCDGEHTLREILERTGGDDLEVLGRLAQLLFEGVIAEGAARRAGSVAVPVVEGALAR
ncbi:MAG: DUF4388 domain-containing protein, partial [Myxococcales bacterium]|nr:DUF4388 domain-containing protein [Myxococcales bacterium]